MSKNVAIKEGSRSKQFSTTKKLRTNLVGGGTADWVPEDEVQLTSLHITEDGEYNANDEGYYGYNPVTVSGIGKATFTAEDGDILFGEELVDGNLYQLDPEDEEDPVKEIPSYIAIEQNPDITQYHDLDPIILTGMKVKAYMNDGTVWKDEEWEDDYIPLDKIIFEPIKADISKVDEKQAHYGDWSFSFANGDTAIIASGRMRETYKALNTTDDTYVIGSIYPYVEENQTVSGAWVMSREQFTPSGDNSHLQHYTLNDKTVYYNGRSAFQTPPFPITKQTQPIVDMSHVANPIDIGLVCWIICYGDVSGGMQKINIKWYRPDGEALSESFEIEVEEEEVIGDDLEGNGGGHDF